MSLLNLDDPKKYEEENEDVLERWIEQILNGTISLGKQKTANMSVVEFFHLIA